MKHPALLLCLCLLVGSHVLASPNKPSTPAPASRSIPALYFPTAEAVSTQTIRVPFRLVGRLIVVEAAAEGQRGNFVLDTGSSKLLLNAVHYDSGALLAGRSMGVTGKVSGVRQKTISDFNWAALPFSDLTVDIIDLGHLERKKNVEILGLIGYEVLRDFEVTIDFQIRQITLTRLDERGERLDSLALLEPVMDSLDFKLQAHWITLSGQVEKTPVRFGLDSGAEVNLLHHRIKRKVLDHFKISRRVVLNGTGQDEVEVLAGKLYRFQCGNQRLSGMRTLLTNMNEMNTAYGTNLDGLVGFEFLCMKRTIINYKKQRLYFLQWKMP